MKNVCHVSVTLLSLLERYSMSSRNSYTSEGDQYVNEQIKYNKDISIMLRMYISLISFLDITGGLLAEKTLCPNSKTYLGYHYDTHSLFGWSQAIPTF